MLQYVLTLIISISYKECMSKRISFIFHIFIFHQPSNSQHQPKCTGHSKLSDKHIIIKTNSGKVFSHIFTQSIMVSALLRLCLFLCLFVGFSNGTPSLLYNAKVRSLKTTVGEKGCNVNVCFAFDTSGSVNETEHTLEKNFVIDITAIIGTDSRARFAAVQYGTKTYPIQRLTDNVERFNVAVDIAEFKKSGFTSVGSGIVWCDRQLRRKAGDANKLILIGDGRNNLGGEPVKRANTFREKSKGLVSTVGIGFKDNATLIEIAGDESRVFEIDEYVELSFVIEDLVYDICGYYLEV